LDKSKINEQRCSLARKGHGNAVTVNFRNYSDSSLFSLRSIFKLAYAN